jgi:hypothetical protein
MGDDAGQRPLVPNILLSGQGSTAGGCCYRPRPLISAYAPTRGRSGGDWIGGSVVVVCRLFGLHAGAEDVDATSWLLDAPFSISEQSHRNPDGYGLATFTAAGELNVVKRPARAAEDETFAPTRAPHTPRFIWPTCATQIPGGSRYPIRTPSPSTAASLRTTAWWRILTSSIGDSELTAASWPARPTLSGFSRSSPGRSASTTEMCARESSLRDHDARPGDHALQHQLPPRCARRTLGTALPRAQSPLRPPPSRGRTAG